MKVLHSSVTFIRWFSTTIINQKVLLFSKFQNDLEKIGSPSIFFIIAYFVLLHMLNHISKIQSGHSVILASSFGQTRPSVAKPDNSNFSDGPLIILSLQLLLISIKNMFL